MIIMFYKKYNSQIHEKNNNTYLVNFSEILKYEKTDSISSMARRYGIKYPDL